MSNKNGGRGFEICLIIVVICLLLLVGLEIARFNLSDPLGVVPSPVPVVTLTLTNTETATITLTTTQTVVPTIKETQQVPAIRYIYTGTLSWFNSYEELVAWLHGVYPEMKEARSPGLDCVDYSWWLIERAMDDGYLMVYHSINTEVYNASFTNLQLDGGHAITATYINGRTYLIEPQNFEVYPNYNVE